MTETTSANFLFSVSQRTSKIGFTLSQESVEPDEAGKVGRSMSGKFWW